MIYNLFSSVFNSNSNKIELVKVYSHPRSGTHLLEAFLAKNFYADRDLKIQPITWGHWTNRCVLRDGNPYGKLFGNHYFSEDNRTPTPKIYIMRDGRAVAYSIWKTKNFLNEEMSKKSLSEFLKTPLDWYGSPSRKTSQNWTVFEHWKQHVEGWKELSEIRNDTIIISYEELIEEPFKIYSTLHKKFFQDVKKKMPSEVITIRNPVGILPNAAKKDSWKTAFTEEDESYFRYVTNN